MAQAAQPNHPNKAGLGAGVRGLATAVPDGDTVLLDTGVHLRLYGIQAPRLSLGRPHVDDWPLAGEARDALSALVLGRRVVMRQGAVRRDRDGRQLGQLHREDADGLWVQGELVRTGWARVYSFPDNRACIAELLLLEARARALRLGIWADPYYALRQADRTAELGSLAGRYELVEGRVVEALSQRGRMVLRFGRHEGDLVAVITARAEHEFAAMGRDPLILGGALIRVRGWVEVSGGLRLTVTHPEQVEVVAAP